LTLDAERLELSRVTGRQGELPLAGSVRVHQYRKPTHATLHARLETQLERKDLANWIDPWLGERGMLSGNAPVWLEFSRQPGDGGFGVKGKADLQQVALRGRMGWHKQAGDPGEATGEGTLDMQGRLTLNPLRVALGNLGFSGGAEWQLARNQGKVTMQRAHLGETRGSLHLAYGNPSSQGQGGGWTGKADLSTLDLRPLLEDAEPTVQGPPRPEPPPVRNLPPQRSWPKVSLDLQAAHLLLANGEGATGLNSRMEMELRSLRFDTLRFAQGAGEVDGAGEFLWSRQIDGGGYAGHMRVNARDFGRLFRSLDLYEGLLAGAGELDVTLDGFLPPDQRLLDTLSGTARFRFRDGKIRRFGFLSTLLGLFSLKELPHLMVGDRPDLDGTGLHYKDFQGVFSIADNVWNIDTMLLKSPSMNLVFTGKVDFPQDQVDLLVGMRPLQTLDALLNGVPLLGKLVTGDRQTMVETQFDVTGSTQSPQVTIRPVTSFAPGLLRDIIAFPLELFKRARDSSSPDAGAR
ncbi:MAG: AsmA-like C-terminal region-containing protein, partial [Magnetococcales bacterium]|nr:AsmA-like C-terminal region-containing protein [Magnetococcales bacterium]